MFKRTFTTFFAIATLTFIGWMSVKATHVETTTIITPTDIATCENGNEESDDYNYDAWHVGSVSCPTDGSSFFSIDEEGNLILDNSSDVTKVAQILKGYSPDTRPTDLSEIIEGSSWTTITPEGGTVGTFQIPVFYDIDGETKKFTTLRSYSHNEGENTITEESIWTISSNVADLTKDTPYALSEIITALGDSYQVLGFGVSSGKDGENKIQSIVSQIIWDGTTYIFAKNNILSLSGFSNQTMRVGDSKTLNGVLNLASFGGTKIEGHHLFVLTSGDESGIEVTSVGIPTFLGTEIPFDFDTDITTGAGADIPLNITIKALKEGSYTFNYKAFVGEDEVINQNFTITIDKRPSSGGGGSYTTTSNTSHDNTDISTIDTDVSHDITDTSHDDMIKDRITQILEKIETIEHTNEKYNDESIEAYLFAKELNITTMPNIEEARIEDTLTRAEFAKMISNYAINILDHTPDKSKLCEFKDLDEVNGELAEYVITACQLGIMGQNMGDSFRPNEALLRADIVTIISRLHHFASDSEGSYYSDHMAAMKEKGFITIDDPDMIEIRDYVFIMLQRIAKSISND